MAIYKLKVVEWTFVKVVDRIVVDYNGCHVLRNSINHLWVLICTKALHLQLVSLYNEDGRLLLISLNILSLKYRI